MPAYAIKVGPVDVGQFLIGFAIVLLLLCVAAAAGILLGNLFAKIAKQNDELRRIERERR